MYCISKWDWQCITMLIENVATALRMDEAKLDNIEDPSFNLTSFFKESESYFQQSGVFIGKETVMDATAFKPSGY